jgi:crotonobetainyl-CoA:carnitine CoA-transferase CaiB-like acyl-CoA transferase
VTATGRRRHRAELEEIIKTWAQGKTRQELWEGLRDLDYFGAPVLSIDEVLEDPHIKVRQAFVERDHPNAGPTTLLAPWIHLSKTPAGIYDDAPALGQHTDEVLGKLLSLSGAELNDLCTQGIIK